MNDLLLTAFFPFLRLLALRLTALRFRLTLMECFLVGLLEDFRRFSFPFSVSGLVTVSVSSIVMMSHRRVTCGLEEHQHSTECLKLIPRQDVSFLSQDNGTVRKMSTEISLPLPFSRLDRAGLQICENIFQI